MLPACALMRSGGGLEGRVHAGWRTEACERSLSYFSHPRAVAGKSRAGGGITLKLLIDERIVLPGANVLSVEYKGATNVATLTADGRIECVVRGGGARGRVGSGPMRGCPRFLAPHASRMQALMTDAWQGAIPVCVRPAGLLHLIAELRRAHDVALSPGHGAASAAAVQQPDGVRADQACLGNNVGSAPLVVRLRRCRARAWRSRARAPSPST